MSYRKVPSAERKEKKQWAVDLVHPYRLVFTKKGEEIEFAYILEIVDYH